MTALLRARDWTFNVVLPPTSWRDGWAIAVDRMLIREVGSERVAEGLPATYCFSESEFGRDVELWRPVLVAQVVAWWHAHRWDIHRLLIRLGFLHDPPGNGGFYIGMRWRWDFWNGNRSWLAFRHARKHGYDSYLKRFPA